MNKTIQVIKEWHVQVVALMIFYLDSIFYVQHEGILISKNLGVDFMFFFYHVLLFSFVIYFLIPKYFNSKRYIQFFSLLIGSIILFGVIEEGIIEKIISPERKGRNDLTWQSIYWFFGEIMVPLLGFMTIKFVFDNFAQKQKLEEIEQNKLKNELKLLRSQIQPHILFNSLNNLYHFALQKSDEVPRLILKLSNVLRYAAYDAHEEKVPLEKELSFLEDYIDLQKVQYEGRGDITYESKISGELIDTKIAPFLLIPFIENSFKHSFGSKVKDVHVSVKIRLIDLDFVMEVTNNYEETEKRKEELLYGGIGLVNVKKRLHLMYPDDHHLDINSQDQMYNVVLNLKLTI